MKHALPRLSGRERGVRARIHDPAGYRLLDTAASYQNEEAVTNTGTFDPYKPTPDGATLHGDHAYVFYQGPVEPRRTPLVFWHGAGQFW